MTQRTYRVGVVGGGVAGTAAAYLLARAGHAVTLFERAPQVGPVGAGVLLQPSGQEMLAKLGLLERVIARAEPIDRIRAQQGDGRTLIDLSYSEFAPHLRAYGIHRGDLFAVLFAEACAAGVQVQLGTTIAHLGRAGRWATAQTADGQVQGTFDFILATDGARSQLRSGCPRPMWVHRYGHGALWALGQTTQIRGRLHQVVRGCRQLVGLLPMGQGRCSLFWSLHEREWPAVQRRGFAAWRAEVIQLCPPAEELLVGLNDFAELRHTTYTHVVMRCPRDAHTLFLGDAAHAMSPHLGQGINLALIDAATFAHALASTPNHRAAFVRFVQLRRRHLRFYSWLTLALTPFFQSHLVIPGWGRDLALPLMLRVPWLRRQMALAMSGLRGGFRGGRLAAV
jgi:2-polyprenyl-6-methoxyphenol hydroxylase-like FAD-dependent oxidoreductase